jgi:osmoprotectant transport system ATP-binding protein
LEFRIQNSKFKIQSYPMSLICFDQVCLKFPGKSQSIAAVDNCSFEVPSGKLVVILGESGCGKTTLLKLVNRLYEPTTGTIYFNQQPIQQMSPIALRRQMGYVIQQSGLFPHMTVAQNIAVVPKLLGWKRTEIQSRIDELLSLVGLPDYRDRYPAQLSGGQQQRVGLARALAADPPVLLMDEPFGAIDAIARDRLQTELLRLQQRLQKTILFVSHDVEEALKLGDYLMLMNAGRIVQYDQPLRILHQPANAFVKALLGTEDLFRHLSLMSVAMVFDTESSSATRSVPSVTPQESLRQALSLMFTSGSRSLNVVSEGGDRLGSLTLQQIMEGAIGARSFQP